MIFFNKSTTTFKLSCLTVGMLLIPQTFAQIISGKVVNTRGKTIANTEVSINNTNKKVLTDEQGRFEITDIDTGEYELHVAIKNYSHFSKHITVQDKNLSDLVFTMNNSVMENIDVYSTPLHASSIESALPISVLSSDELRLKQASTLGDTLKGELGIHSSYYGPVASSPIIRGLDGPRVMITQNGLDVGDASRVGPDHVVSSDASTATQIEVLRGPATLFYGSGAIGGVVNVVDNRIPTTIDDQVDYFLKHNDVADENEASINVNTGLELDKDSAIAFHVDAFYRESNDYKLPSSFSDEDEHEEEEGHEDEEHEDEEHEDEEHSDTLDNSSSRAKGFTIGTSYIVDNGFIGFSYGYLDRKYGLPGHGAHEEEGEEEGEEEEHEEDEHEEEEIVFIQVKQDRYQLLSDLSFDNQWLNRLTSKLAYTDYIHQEIEDGAPGTTFKNKLFESRFNFYHSPINDWKGAFTLHYKTSDFEAIGEEAFTPPSTTDMVALAWLEEKHFDNVLVQVGARAEHISLEAEQLDNTLTLTEDLRDQSFTPISTSLGMVWNYTQGYNLGMSLGYSQRAPAASEVFSNGAHIATSTFELGALLKVNELTKKVELSNNKIELETSLSADLTFRKFEGNVGIIVSAFYNRIDDYYYQRNTGLTTEIFEEDEHEEDEHGHEEDALDIFAYEQSDVDLYGFESEFIYKISPNLTTKLFGDYIRAKLTSGENLPRTPPLRIGSELSYTGDKFAATLTAQRYFNQNKTAENETSTDGYSLIDANINYYVNGIGDDFVVFLKVDNITDEDARVHTSFLKDSVPLPGRGFSIGVRGSF